MSVMSITDAVARIKSAPPNSPVAVFRCIESEGHVNCVFANTVRSQWLINAKDPAFIGAFSCEDHPDIVRARLLAFIRGY